MTKKNDERNVEIAQTEKIGLGDFLIAVLLGGATSFFLWYWEYPWIYPGVWNEAVVAFGVRPATGLLPGFWTFAATVIHAVFGEAFSAAVMRMIGHVLLGCTAVLVYALLREMLAFIMRARPQRSRRRTLVMQLASAMGATAFVAADPVWTAGQCFTETEILLLLTFGALEFFFVFLRKGTLKWAYLSMFLLGLLSAETPMGFALLAVFIGLNGFILKVMPMMESPFFKPAVIAVGKWHLTFIFIVAFSLGVGLNCYTFVMHNGLGAVGGNAGSLPMSYLSAYISLATRAATPVGWLMMTAVCFVPFLVSIFRFPTAADEEQFLPYSTGMVFFACGAAAFSQCSSLSSLWFWKSFPVNSSYLLICGLFLVAVTFAGAMTILGVDALCRNHRRLTNIFYGNEDDDDSAIETAMSRRLTNALRRAGIVIVPLFVICTIVPGRIRNGTNEMTALVRDAVAEIIREAQGSRYIVTDGQLDSAIELMSARQGVDLTCVSLMGGSGAMASYLRTRGMAGDREDSYSFGFDGAMGLRTWIRDRPERLTNCTVQVGFDLWKRDGKALPPMGGMLSRPSGWKDEAERLAGIENARALARRVIGLYDGGAVRSCGDDRVRHAFESVVWRLARMCVYRGERADLSGDSKTAIAEAKLAKELNDRNGAYQSIVRSVEKSNETMLRRLTPREGLQLSLVRADYVTAKIYAEVILGGDPENADANFAMGMYYQAQNQYTRAEEYLKRCLVRRPNGPEIYNNLAMLQLRLGKLDAAAVNVDKALKLLPDSAAVRDTKRRIDAMRAR